jgi:hypothetical protein
MDLGVLVIHLASGAAVGAVAAKRRKTMDLGPLGNVLAGGVGGGIGGQVLERAMALAPIAGGAFDPGTIATQIAGGVAGGGILIASVGVLGRLFAK